MAGKGCTGRIPLKGKKIGGLLFLSLSFLFVPHAAVAAESVCYGTTAAGKLEQGCKLPYEGDNFTAYSLLGSILGRTFVHCKVAEAILAAYENLQERHPDKVFVYGETGWPTGGRFKPHKTHQNGLSVDFMVPVVNRSGESVPLPTHALNKYGYAIEFDAKGKAGELTIDFEAMTAHILALEKAAEERQIKIRRVIFDQRLQPFLHATRAWPELEGKIQFSARGAWVRHDEHYHVDFEIPCKPMP